MHDPSAEVGKKKGLTKYNIVMLIITVAVVSVGAGMIVGEQVARGGSEKFYQAVNDGMDEVAGNALNRGSVATLAEEHNAGEPVTVAVNGRRVDRFTWNGVLQRYVVAVTYDAQYRVRRVTVDSVSRFAASD